MRKEEVSVKSQKVPGPRFIESFKLIPEFRKNLLPTMEKLFLKYGNYLEMSVLGSSTFFIFHPDGIEHVLKSNHKNFIKGDDSKEVSRLLGLGLLTSDGDLWLRHRRILAPEFQQKKMAN